VDEIRKALERLSPASWESAQKLFDKLRTAELKEACQENLTTFIREAWRYLDPAPYIHGWHIDAISEHLQAVTDGEIKRLIINVPPRTSKSTIVSVAFPAWIWTQNQVADYAQGVRGPSVQFLTTSYAASLSNRDAQKMRRLIESPWYQSLWGDRFQLLQSTITKFDNDKGGYRLATSVGAHITGEGGDIIIVDDPHNAMEPESDVTRQSTLDWWDQAMSTRLNNPKTGAFIVIMQRLHQEDLTGHILASEVSDEWTHLCLPMRYEPSRHCATGIGWQDPRGYSADGHRRSPEESDGDLLCPSRFGDREVSRIESSLGPWGAAGQLQQRPEPRGGGLIKDEWWQIWDHEAQMAQGLKKNEFPAFDYIMASYDGAFTEKEENDYSALTIWGTWKKTTPEARAESMAKYGDESYAHGQQSLMLIYAWRKRLSLHGGVSEGKDDRQLMFEWSRQASHETFEQFKLKEKEKLKSKWGVVEWIVDTCRRYRVEKLIIEGKANGITVAQELQRVYSRENWVTQLYVPDRDKEARVLRIQHVFSNRLVWTPDPERTDWAMDVVSEFRAFPRGSHDDLVDSSTAALHMLNRMRMMETPVEAEEKKEFSIYGDPSKPPGKKQIYES
jgi:predicted phage terminase large subunit-like protein